MLLWPPFLFGSLPNQGFEGEVFKKDYIACARMHCEAKSLIKLDIKDFFDNVTDDLVNEVFQEVLKYPADVSDILTKICTYRGAIVQGALTSSYIASLVLHDVEGRVYDRLKRKGYTYTRYVDDITISSKTFSAPFDFPKNIVRQMLEGKDLPLNESKTKIQRQSTEPLTVHGLRVSFGEPRLPSDEVRRIRAAVKMVENLAQEPNYRTSPSYRRDFNKCMGRVNKLSRVGHKQHAALVRRLREVIPLPSKKDIERAEKMIVRLEKDFSTKKSTYWYAKRFYMAYERIGIIKRSFPATARELRERLRSVRTIYS